MRVLLIELCSVSRPPPLGSEVSVGWELHHSTQISQRWGWLNTELHLYGQTEHRHSLRDRQKRPRGVQTCSTPYVPIPSRTSLPGPRGGASWSSTVQGIHQALLCPYPRTPSGLATRTFRHDESDTPSSDHDPATNPLARTLHISTSVLAMDAR